MRENSSYFIQILLLAFAHFLFGDSPNREIDLRREWRFEIGDNLEFADPELNDSKWISIKVPGAWENEGFPGFDGYGWYRISFTVPNHLKHRCLFLKLGQIDDVDRTYINGHFLGGHGDFPPNYLTAYDVHRIYEIPTNFIKFGKRNVLSVRVFDHHGGGGIVHGDVGIYSHEHLLNLQIDLSGLWKFKTGDEWEWATMEYDDTQWKSITTPSTWEQQGYIRHDGFAWYRKLVKIPKSLTRSKLILILGKINDVDEVYFNGAKIGETGEFPKNKNDKIKGHKDVERAYFIPPYLIQTAQANIIAVRVFDSGQNGGIYSGYVGIASRDDYLKYFRKKKQTDQAK